MVLCFPSPWMEAISIVMGVHHGNQGREAAIWLPAKTFPLLLAGKRLVPCCWWMCITDRERTRLWVGAREGGCCGEKQRRVCVRVCF